MVGVGGNIPQSGTDASGGAPGTGQFPMLCANDEHLVSLDDRDWQALNMNNHDWPTPLATSVRQWTAGLLAKSEELTSSRPLLFRSS